MFRVLVLHENPKLQDHLLNSLGKRLADQSITHVDTVDFACCPQITSLALHQLFESFRQPSLSSLRTLILKETNISNHCLLLLASQPCLQATLAKLNIDCCGLLTSQGIALFCQLYRFRQLRHLSMDATLVDDSALAALAS